MSDTSSNPNARGDELSSQRLDGDASSPDVTTESHDEASLRRAADVQLVHALLLHLNDDAAEKESRLTRVIARL